MNYERRSEYSSHRRPPCRSGARSHGLDADRWHDAPGRDRVLPFVGNEERIRSEYYDALREEMRAEEARALRQGHRIVIDEAVLARR